MQNHCETGGRLRVEFENAAKAIKLHEDQYRGLPKNHRYQRQKERLEAAWNRRKQELTLHLTDCNVCVISGGE